MLLAVNSLHADWLDQFMFTFSGRWTWLPLYVALVYVLWRREGARRTLVYLAGIALTITLADQISATLIRPAVCRLRPANLDNPLSAAVHIVNGYRGGRYGFPSCHAANSIALAVYMSLIVRQRSFVWLICGWAVANSYTRLYLGVHYPGDLLVGGVIGGLCACFMYRCAQYAVCRFGIGERDSADHPARLLPAVVLLTLAVIFAMGWFEN